jgi:hypothetical protein
MICEALRPNVRENAGPSSTRGLSAPTRGEFVIIVVATKETGPLGSFELTATLTGSLRGPDVTHEASENRGLLASLRKRSGQHNVNGAIFTRTEVHPLPLLTNEDCVKPIKPIRNSGGFLKQNEGFGA